MAKKKNGSDDASPDTAWTDDDADETEGEDELEASDDVDELPANFESQPEGYEQIGSTQAPFVLKYRGAIIEGELIGRFLRQNPSGMGSPFFYQVRLSRQAKGVAGSKMKGTLTRVVAQPGELLSLDEMASLKDLAPLCEDIENGAKYHIVLKFVGKIKTSKGNSFWDVRKFKKQIKPPRISRAQADAAAGRVIS